MNDKQIEDIINISIFELKQKLNYNKSHNDNDLSIIKKVGNLSTDNKKEDSIQIKEIGKMKFNINSSIKRK